jgi:chromosomal replication initiator protein
LDLPEDVALLVAERITPNPRDLEGAVARLRGHAALHDGRIDLEVAREALNEMNALPPRRISVEEIITAVTQRFGVKSTDLLGKRRTKSIALPRQVCMHLARRLTEHSLGEIGGFFGGRDHTTVLHADRTVGRLREQNPQLGTTLDAIESGLRR